MTSKERVNAVLMGEIPDKVPWGEWAIDFDTVSNVRLRFFQKLDDLTHILVDTNVDFHL